MARANKQHWKQWAEKKGVDELKECSWQAPDETFMKSTSKATVDGVMAHETFCMSAHALEALRLSLINQR